ncbi:hypothetical protein AUJ67_04740 [Candidatus Desantisbacteria bacterium CG1_02_49_89]|nr:MAG: hypothetical protein AUJ67_04740 [Candidatus Desantisbacteria bacterium CG1_02_49_89]
MPDEIIIPSKDRDVLRRLAEETAEIAALPAHKEKAGLWTRLNDLRSARPMVLISQVCWNEMNLDNELTLQTSHPWARGQEFGFRASLYKWRHMPDDMFFGDSFWSPLAIRSTGFGIDEDVDIVKTDETSDVVSRHFNVQIRNPEDIEKILMPVVTHNEKATEAEYQTMSELYKGIMPVKKVGRTHIWFAPWDNLIRWYGIKEAMMDMIDRPEMVNSAVSRVVDGYMAELDQLEKLNLLSLETTGVGSGGYGNTSDLPGAGCDPGYARPHDLWGCSNAQIFSEVSPDMHWEFAIRHDMRWLERWGLNYYGCCEPLDRKIHILRRIPNLRKISISPWADIDRAVENIGSDFVVSYKPNPAILAEESWHPERARAALRKVLERTGKKCHVEIILKDISTVRYKPQRLWEWSRIAMETAEEFSR